MIKRLNHKDTLNFYEFIKRIGDKFEDFYLTENKTRIMIDDLKVANKLLRYQEVYAIQEKEIKGILLILREKGYRTYIKILAENSKYAQDLFKYINWNFNGELFLKIKKLNPITRIVQLLNIRKFPKYGFEFLGSRGLENLYIRKKREIRKNDRHDYKTERPDSR